MASEPCTQPRIKRNALEDILLREKYVPVNNQLHWQWYVDLLRERQACIDAYKKSSPKALATSVPKKCDCSRTVLPFPETTSGEYGWLASKKEFQLETYNLFKDSFKLNKELPETYSSEFFSASNV